MDIDNLKHDVSFRYFDMNGREVKEGDIIRFTLYDGMSNKEVVVRKDEQMNEFGIEGLYPPMMKYLEFVIIDNGS
jgi:hypothetical protein